MLQVLLNKIALSSFHFESPNALLLFQCFLCVILVQACKAAGLVKVEPLNWNIIKIWVPVNLVGASLPSALPACPQHPWRRNAAPSP